MRRRRLKELDLDHYPMMTPTEKETAQELVFQYYYDRNDMDIEVALDEINGDIYMLQEHEMYERCAILKDILERFE